MKKNESIRYATNEEIEEVISKKSCRLSFSAGRSALVIGALFFAISILLLFIFPLTSEVCLLIGQVSLFLSQAIFCFDAFKQRDWTFFVVFLCVCLFYIFLFITYFVFIL